MIFGQFYPLIRKGLLTLSFRVYSVDAHKKRKKEST